MSYTEPDPVSTLSEDIDSLHGTLIEIRDLLNDWKERLNLV